jgi:DNA mismatch endonuclease (patch repair protein)
MDRLNTEERSNLMRRVAQASTAPELIVRKTLHQLGYRYLVNDKRLPGSPDIVFPSRRCVMFVHGCFWHGHRCKHRRIVPKTNTAFWSVKIRGNRSRDARKRRELRKLGWSVLEVWQCQVSAANWLNVAIQFLEQRSGRRR